MSIGACATARWEMTGAKSRELVDWSKEFSGSGVRWPDHKLPCIIPLLPCLAWCRRILFKGSRRSLLVKKEACAENVIWWWFSSYVFMVTSKRKLWRVLFGVVFTLLSCDYLCPKIFRINLVHCSIWANESVPQWLQNPKGGLGTSGLDGTWW